MNRQNIKKLRNSCAYFRQIIERADLSNSPICFTNFPLGTCSNTSLLLAKYLQEHKYGTFTLVSGERNEYTHAWLEQKGLIIDITGDQFNNMPNKVFVGYQSDWHKSFSITNSDPADLDKFDKRTNDLLGIVYSMLLVSTTHNVD